MTSHLSLQYAALIPSPFITPAKNVLEHTPLVTWEHDDVHEPFSSKSEVTRAEAVMPISDDVAKSWP